MHAVAPIKLKHQEPEVVVIDPVTAIPLGRPAQHDEPTDHEMFKAQHHTPDGSAANAHEGRTVPWIVGSLAIAGLALAGISMYAVGGPQAATVGVVWVLAGYGVAWIVVWGAAVARGREEREIEQHIRDEHAKTPVRR